jgi:23S rRNA (cytosine1962-C5)-methyltransferase
MTIPFDRLAAALAARAPLLDERHEGALRLFNGFLEGWPELVVDVYARTLVVYNYAEPPAALEPLLPEIYARLRETLPWVEAVVLKTRTAPDEAGRRGVPVYGARIARRVRENGVWYALDLCARQDAGLYLDTRGLRAWAKAALAGRTVLNTFAHTGSLGVAAMAGGAARVLHLDRNRAVLNQAKESYALNGFPVRRSDFLAGDFWVQAAQLRREGAQFDCVLLDAPFFSSTPAGAVALEGGAARLINKVRPLVAGGGYLVAVNNALFVSGRAYLDVLDELAADGYLALEALIPVPPDCAGFPATVVAALPADPAPFNHATKIAVLRVRRKAAGA